MDRDSLMVIASGTRCFLETVWPQWQLDSVRRHGSVPPEILSSSTCGRSSTFVQRVLTEFGFAAEVIHGRFGPSEDRHAWVACGPWLIDVTADQFGAAEVIVTERSDGRYRMDIDVAFPEAQRRRIQLVAEIWQDWLRSPMRENLLWELGKTARW